MAAQVGALQSVKVTASGFGSSASEAVSEALRLAVLQVNGATIDHHSLQARIGLEATLGKDRQALQGQAFVDELTQRSGGVVQHFKLLDLTEPGLVDKRYKAQIEAHVASFAAPESLKKLKLVVTPPRFASSTLVFGDLTVPSHEVAAMVRQRVADTLLSTGRFALLDRDVSAELAQELSLIESGQVPAAERAKRSQVASADVLWTGTVSQMAYRRHAQALRASDRELVSYSGGWAISQKLVSVPTRQVLVADTLQGQLPATAPTTLSSGVDGRKAMETMINNLVQQVVASIMRRTFPVSVVQRDGDQVVLSQGSSALREGSRYAVVRLGAELKDPQTGQSLGRSEAACCEVLIERVTAHIAYGRLSGGTPGSLGGVAPGALELRQELAPAPNSASTKPTLSDATVAKSARTPKPTTEPAQRHTAPSTTSKDDDKW
ncbi:CsgG/HfaB family protein [Roseateles sp. BYS180W]|uniref:CsgG/HfaB family protein n=1 Tax=Roseateles rivi TaxID=3299028 RepID=A0ABW7FYI8_9BURK